MLQRHIDVKVAEIIGNCFCIAFYSNKKEAVKDPQNGIIQSVIHRYLR